MKDHMWKIIGVVAVVAIGASIVYSNSVSNKANEGVTFTDHIKGNPDASVTITEYSDFQCPACGQFSLIVQEVLDTYPEDVKLEYKHFPLVSIHPYAIPAAKAAEAAGQQGKFFEMHDKLFENQQTWSQSANPALSFQAYAEEIGLDMKLYKQHIKASKIQDKINNEFRAARELGLTGTPSFFLNGQRMQFETYQDFMDQIAVAVNPDAVSEEGEATPVSTEPAVKFGL